MEELKNTMDEESVNSASTEETVAEMPEVEAIPEDEGISSKLGAFVGKVVNKITAMKKKTLIILAAAIVVVLGGAITAAAYFNSPKVVAMNAITGFVEDFIERDEFSVVTDMLDGGSLEASLSKLQNDGEDMLDGASFSGKVYFDKDAIMFENIAVSANGQKINGNIYLSEDMIYISEDELIKEAYGAEFDKLADDLKDSIFAYGSGSDYAIPSEEIYNAIIEILENEENRTL